MVSAPLILIGIDLHQFQEMHAPVLTTFMHAHPPHDQLTRKLGALGADLGKALLGVCDLLHTTSQRQQIFWHRVRGATRLPRHL